MRRIMRLKGMNSHLYLVPEDARAIVFTRCRAAEDTSCRRQRVDKVTVETNGVRRFAKN